MFTIRPFDFSDADYAAMMVIDNAVFPQYAMTADAWRHIDETRPAKCLFHRDMIEVNGEPVAFGDFGQSQWAFHPHKFNFNIFVHPDHEHPEIRPLYFEHAMAALAEHDPIAITSAMFEDRETHLDFLAEMGFKEIKRDLESVLDVTTFDASRFAHISEKMNAGNIQIVSLRELQDTDPDWKQKFFELYWAFALDVPSTAPPVKQSLEEFEKGTLDYPDFTADGCFIALDGYVYVGLSHAWIDQLDNERLNGSLTGVIRSHRRRGIATALKLRLIDYAIQYGAKIITTGNDQNNPMYQINVALGFKSRPSWLTFAKKIRAE